jgi:hypothetical protein
MIIQLSLEDLQLLQTYTNKINEELRKRGITFQVLPDEVATDLLVSAIEVMSRKATVTDPRQLGSVGPSTQ